MRTELETKFYSKSSWSPPKAGVEVEQFIKHVQTKFDRWKPAQWIADNLSKREREFLKKIKSDDEIIYMWEDKGPSFTKMRINQYISAGEKELQNPRFYEEVPSECGN